MDTTLKPLARYLTHDDIEAFHDKKGDEWTYRIRIWQGKDAIPIVLAHAWDTPKVEFDTGAAELASMSCVVANFVNSAMLGHPITGMMYFEDSWFAEEACDQFFFEYFGNAHRLFMFSPTLVTHPWSHLEEIVGEKIEH